MIKKLKKPTTILNIIGLILLIFPIGRYLKLNVPMDLKINKWLFTLSMLSFILSQAISLSKTYKASGRLEKRHIGNIIAFSIVLVLIAINF